MRSMVFPQYENRIRGSTLFVECVPKLTRIAPQLGGLRSQAQLHGKIWQSASNVERIRFW